MSAEVGRAGRSGAVVIVGVLSDTHSHLYSEVKKALEGVDHIIHAGDVGSPQVLAELRALAPVTAVQGNCDCDAWAQALPARAELTLAGARLAVGHVGPPIDEWVKRQEATGGHFDVVIFGHSHMAALEWRRGVLYLNPGSAGPRRFNRPRSIAKLTIRPAASGEAKAAPALQAEIITLD